MFEFIQPKISSVNWGERYVGMLAFSSILEGPNPENLANIINDAYPNIVKMIDDPVPKVRQTVAYSLYKLSDFLAVLVFSSPESLDVFI